MPEGRVVSFTTQDGKSHTILIPSDIRILTTGGNIQEGRIEDYADDVIVLRASKEDFKFGLKRLESVFKLPSPSRQPD